jgi:anti-sigma regulatory factor (Ser/Thr protein kinase)
MAAANEARISLAPDLNSPRKARAFLAMLLHEWGLTHLDDKALLLASELVTNAVLHAQATSTLSACVDDEALEIRVTDPDEALPERLQPEPDAEAGRGLMLVSTLADSWGVEPLQNGGKAIWFRLRP